MASQTTGLVQITSEVSTTIFRDISFNDYSIKTGAGNQTVLISKEVGAGLVNIVPTWHNVKCAIKKGLQYIPEDVLEWESFIRLVKRGKVGIIDNSRISGADAKKVLIDSGKDKKEPRRSGVRVNIDGQPVNE